MFDLVKCPLVMPCEVRYHGSSGHPCDQERYIQPQSEPSGEKNDPDCLTLLWLAGFEIHSQRESCPAGLVLDDELRRHGVRGLVGGNLGGDSMESCRRDIKMELREIVDIGKKGRRRYRIATSA
mgnify:CR=1 FL=1